MDTPEYRKPIDADTMRLIGDAYSIRILNAEQLFTGADKNTYVYRIEPEHGKTYFLKIRTGEPDISSIIIPYALLEKIGRHIIGPVKTRSGDLFLQTPGFTVTVYPFIHGKSAGEIPLSVKQWEEFGELLRGIHNFRLPEGMVCAARETFSNRWGKTLADYMKNLGSVKTETRSAEEFIRLLADKEKTVGAIIKRAEELERRVKTTSAPYCLCHGDIHAGNLLVQASGEFFIVDWDTLILAPKERDLMFIGGGIADTWYSEEETGYFYAGYGGRENTDRALVSYYRYERIIGDIVEYYNQFFEEDAGETTRQAITGTVASAFGPNSAVDMALRGDNA